MLQYLVPRGDAPPETEPERLACFDVFCGIGGFSMGASEAGHDVVFASDMDADALAAHKANHPNAVHTSLEMPRQEDELLAHLPATGAMPDGTPVHLHLSPPCTNLSQAKSSRATVEDKLAAVDLTEWALNFALHRCTVSSFSFEQVAVPRVLKVCERVRRANLGRFAYVVVRGTDYGIPQRRRRVVGGSPKLVRRLLQRQRSFPAVMSTPRHWIGAEGCVEPYICWPHYRTNKSLMKSARPMEPHEIRKRHITKPAYTVTTTSPLYWITQEGAVGSVLSVEALARLQTFPHRTVFPKSKTLAKKFIGNALPPQLAKTFMGRRVQVRRPPRLPAMPDSPSLLPCCQGLQLY